MADYFDEMGWTPLGEGGTPNQLLHMARLFRDFNMFEESGLGQDLAPPASKKAVEELPKVPITNSRTQCPVCLKDFPVGGQAVQLPCQHMFDESCILPWLGKTNSCPLCRHELPTDDENYEAFRKEKIRAKAREADLAILHDSMFG